MPQNLILKKYTGKSKKTGKEFHAYELRAGLFSRLIFPNGKIEEKYLDNFLSGSAHDDFQGDDFDELFDKSDD